MHINAAASGLTLGCFAARFLATAACRCVAVGNHRRKLETGVSDNPVFSGGLPPSFINPASFCASITRVRARPNHEAPGGIQKNPPD